MNDELDDDQLEERLRQLAARWEPVPPELMSAAADAFGWRDVDAELAALAYDSLVSQDAAALVRSAAGRRLFSFRAGELTIDIEVTHTGQALAVLGQIMPPRAGRVELRRGRDVITVTADDLGRFRSEPLAPGPLSLRLGPPPGATALAGPGAAVVTDWVSI